MSEQAQILAQMQQIIMKILESGTATVEEADKIDELEELLYQQKCFKEIESSEYTYQGEEIASLFFTDNNEKAISKLCECGITPDDFFGFAEYFYDDEHEDEEKAEMFTPLFIAEVNKAYESSCK